MIRSLIGRFTRLFSLLTGGLAVLAIARSKVSITIVGFMTWWVDKYIEIKSAFFRYIFDFTIPLLAQDLITIYFLIGTAALGAHLINGFPIKPSNLLPLPFVHFLSRRSFRLRHVLDAVLAYPLQILAWPFFYLRVVRNGEIGILANHLRHRSHWMFQSWSGFKQFFAPLRSSYVFLLPFSVVVMVIFAIISSFTSYLVEITLKS